MTVSTIRKEKDVIECKGYLIKNTVNKHTSLRVNTVVRFINALLLFVEKSMNCIFRVKFQ